jgi:hypothetical protein
VKPVRSYVIYCVQRTGSWLLAHTLADTGYAGRPSDYFDDAEQENHSREWGVRGGDPTAYIRAMRDKATTPNGVLGSKLMWNDFDSLRSSISSPAGMDPGLEFMRTTFPDLVSSGCGVRTKCGKASRGGERPRQISGGCGRAKSPSSQHPTWSRWCGSSSSRSGARMPGGSGSAQPEYSLAKSAMKISHGTGSRSRTEFWSFCAFRDSMQTSFRPFATVSRPTA